MSDFSLEPLEGSVPGVTLLRLTGPLTLSSLPALQTALRAVATEGTVLDLGGVPHMDSAGLGALITFLGTQRKAGKRMALANPAKRVKMLFDLTKVNTVLPIFASVAEAEQAVQVTSA